MSKPTGILRGHSRIINGDSRHILTTLEGNSVDSIIVDPPYELGFTGSLGKSWDSTGVAFDVDLWREALRVLKPGGNLAAFGASRTSHRLAVAIEDAGFEIRDTILVWMYGQGQAKGTDVSRELRKAGSPAASDAAGFHTNLKPAHEPIIIARKPLSGNVTENWDIFGVGGLNIDATRIATTESRSRTPGDAKAATWAIQRGNDKNESHQLGRWTPNVLLCHTPECTEAACTPNCAVAEVHAQGLATRGRGEDVTRFFPTFRYQPKAIKSERPEVNGVQHPTVKPLALISWLIELLTPTGGTVLDFFAGSGTTGEAAELLGFASVLIERDPESMPLINQRFNRIGA
jgi:hypothetical protein